MNPCQKQELFASVGRGAELKRSGKKSRDAQEKEEKGGEHFQTSARTRSGMGKNIKSLRGEKGFRRNLGHSKDSRTLGPGTG